jgi:hypothetical protein
MTNANTEIQPDEIQHTETDDHVEYRNARTGKKLRVSRMGLVAAAFTASDWHGGQWSDLYALSCGAFDYDTVVSAATELARATDKADPDRVDDDAIEALAALDEIAAFDF